MNVVSSSRDLACSMWRWWGVWTCPLDAPCIVSHFQPIASNECSQCLITLFQHLATDSKSRKVLQIFRVLFFLGVEGKNIIWRAWLCLNLNCATPGTQANQRNMSAPTAAREATAPGPLSAPVPLTELEIRHTKVSAVISLHTLHTSTTSRTWATPERRVTPLFHCNLTEIHPHALKC